MQDRYSKNRETISKAENVILYNKKACVVGCGGIGGYVIEMLARVGVGAIMCVDGDSFDETNLNRQILSREDNLGSSKALEAKKRIGEINSGVRAIAYDAFFDRNNAKTIIDGCDIIFDALDNEDSRLLLQDEAAKNGLPVIHGSIAGWYGQVSVIYPGCDVLGRIYNDASPYGAEKELGTPSFTPALIASIEVAEGIKCLLGKESKLKGRILTVDLLNDEFDVVDL